MVWIHHRFSAFVERPFYRHDMPGQPTSLKHVVVDTTLSEKNIRFPTDSHCYN